MCVFPTHLACETVSLIYYFLLNKHSMQFIVWPTGDSVGWVNKCQSAMIKVLPVTMVTARHITILIVFTMLVNHLSIIFLITDTSLKSFSSRRWLLQGSISTVKLCDVFTIFWQLRTNDKSIKWHKIRINRKENNCFIVALYW